MTKMTDKAQKQFGPVLQTLLYCIFFYREFLFMGIVTEN